jgi:hypothetical protein
VLYREVLAKKTKHNGWAAGYATIVGALFLPGQRHEVYGYIEASMFDVKTGLLMFTTRRSIIASQRTNVWYSDDKREALASNTTSKFAPASMASRAVVMLASTAATTRVITPLFWTCKPLNAPS